MNNCVPKNRQFFIEVFESTDRIIWKVQMEINKVVSRNILWKKNKCDDFLSLSLSLFYSFEM